MEAKKLLDEAFAILSAIPVSGDSVELMAAAKAKLKRAYQAIGTPEKEKKHGG